VGYRYSKSPLVEAVFEFAPVGAAFDGEMAKRMDSLFLPKYSGKRDEIPTLPFAFEKKEGQPLKPPEPIIRYRRWNEKETALIQFSQSLCAFNALKPYTHFVDYLPEMENLFQLYTGETKAKKTLFLGQRYINIAQLPSIDEPPSDYFTVFPRIDLVVKGPQPFSMTLQVDTLPGEKRGRVTLSIVYRGNDGLKPVYILDLYAQTENFPPIPFTWESVSLWQKEAHQPIETAFNAVLTEKGKKLFGWEEESQ